MGKPDKKHSPFRWVIQVTVITFITSGSISLLSENSMRSLSLTGAAIVLLFLVLIGILCDLFGTAITAANLTPFLAMAAKRVPGSHQGVWLLKRADRVTNILNDVVGDISSIISGAAGASIALRVAGLLDANALTLSILISALSAALMVGGKAWGKWFAIENSEKVLLFVGKFLGTFDPRTWRKNAGTKEKRGNRDRTAS